MTTYSIREICERFAVGDHTVLTWIRRRELKAIDVSRKPGGRPKWRITREALAAFEALRTPTPAPPPPRSRRRKRPGGVVEFTSEQV
jgi:excisionase family DNA binding protein